MITKDYHTFFKDLSKNNNREWFHANKKRYEKTVKQPWINFVQELINQLQKTHPEIQIEPKQAIFRINRDIRFSKDKSPYKTHCSAIISKYGRKSKEYPGYYVHLSNGELSIGGGAYFLERGDLSKVRSHIANDPKGFKKAISGKKFVEYFDSVKGEKNKRLPKEFQEAAQVQPLIANKQFYFMANMDPKLSLKTDFVKNVINHFKAGKVFNEFLIEAIQS